jgi:ectoine hydroxylase-related dioxygenase (phytanoyl-CoA dioxygenase family)
LLDFWVWHVPPSSRIGGWPRHRDFHKRVVREADSLPGRINVWLALTDAPLDHACIHVVPLPSDPNYPHALERYDATESRALPATAGTALAWDANVLHWGGAANPHAPSARISFAVTFERPGYGEETVDFGRTFSFSDRIDVIANQIVAYERYVPELPVELRDWARALVGLRRRFKGG